MIKHNENSDDMIKQSIWRQTQNGDWKLFFNVTDINKNQKSENEAQLKTILEGSIKKPLKIGTLVMTPNGIARLIKLEGKTAKVKFLKDEVEETFEVNSVTNDFQVFIRILDKEYGNWYRLNLQANGSVENIKKQIEELKIMDLSNCNYVLIYNGIEIKEEFSFDQIDLKPNSKILLCGQKVTSCKVIRFNTTYMWWYTYACDGITFSVNKKVKLVGIGMYGSHESKVQPGTIKLFEGTVTNMGSILLEEQVEVPAAPDQNNCIFPINFKKPVNIKPNIDYTIQLLCTSYCYLYYGSGAKATIEGEKGVEFNFKYTLGSSHGTGVESGNFPEFYYYA